MISIQRQKQLVKDWQDKFRAASTTKRQNPFHEGADCRQTNGDGINFTHPRARESDDLSAELEAWDAASDEDFEKFESELG